MKKKNLKTRQPALRFSPTAWAKLLFLRDLTDNEVGGFGITPADDLLLVTDFVLVKQKVTSISVSFEDESVADFFADQVEASRRPEQFARLWVHSHPGDSAQPSGIDEATFSRVFGNCNWSAMCIVAQNGDTFARLQFCAGPGAAVEIPVCVDYSQPFEATDFALWKKQYDDCVIQDHIFDLDSQSAAIRQKQSKKAEVFGNSEESLCDNDFIEHLEDMEPSRRQSLLNELAIRSDFWDEEMEVFYE